MLSYWINLEKNKLPTKYENDRENHDKHRAVYDMDCMLCNSNLHADMVFSLWLPLRHTLEKLNNGNKKINDVLKTNVNKNNVIFLSNLRKNDSLLELLPESSSTVQLLSELFYYGQQRANVMILPERWMQKRGKKSYYDYMPYFLYECFAGGDFSKAFSSDASLRQWINEQALSFFFNGSIDKCNIIDLAGNGNLKSNITKNLDGLNYMLTNYIDIIKKRKAVI